MGPLRGGRRCLGDEAADPQRAQVGTDPRLPTDARWHSEAAGCKFVPAAYLVERFRRMPPRPAEVRPISLPNPISSQMSPFHGIE